MLSQFLAVLQTYVRVYECTSRTLACPLTLQSEAHVCRAARPLACRPLGRSNTHIAAGAHWCADGSNALLEISARNVVCHVCASAVKPRRVTAGRGGRIHCGSTSAGMYLLGMPGIHSRFRRMRVISGELLPKLALETNGCGMA